jgi:hypothetical protein
MRAASFIVAGAVHVTTARVQAGWEVVKGGPQSEAGHRRVDLAGPRRRHAQGVAAGSAVQRLETGPLWTDSGFVFTKHNRQPWHPDMVTDTFERLSFRAHLPSAAA